MPIRAAKPEKIEKRLKMFLYGPHGSRKTTSAIQFPKAVLIDMERGSENYKRSIDAAGSAIIQTTSPDDVIDEIKGLLTEKHDYRTLILDPITIFYEALQEKWTRLFEKHTADVKNRELQDFGMRYWGRVKAEYKAMLRLLLKLDMNIIATAHQKDIYGSNMSKMGVGPDSMKGDAYFFDNVFQLKVSGDKAIAVTEKQRCDPLDPIMFPPEFEWSYPNFCKYYGKEIIEKEAAPVAMASPEQVAEIKRLVDLVRVDDETINKWLTKTDCDSFEEMESADIQKCIDFVNKKLTKGDK